MLGGDGVYGFLTVQEEEGTAVQADIGAGLRPQNLADMRAFLNLSGFLTDFLPLCGGQPFRGWVHSHRCSPHVQPQPKKRPTAYITPLAGLCKALPVGMTCTRYVLLSPSGEELYSLVIKSVTHVFRWADVLGVELMAGASNRPLLSGFYRMMAVVLRLSEEGGLFSQDEADAGHLAYGQVQSSHWFPHYFAYQAFLEPWQLPLQVNMRECDEAL